MTTGRSSALLVVGLLALSALDAGAEVTLVGEPIDVIAHDPYNFENSPRICADSSGAFTVAWREGSSRFHARRFSRQGQPLTEPFSLLQDSDASPVIACTPSGGLLLVWMHPSHVYGESELRARMFGPDGYPTSSIVRLDEEGYWNAPFDAECGVSSCVVTWTRTAFDTEFESVLVRHVDLDGQPMGHEFVLDSSSFDDAFPGKGLRSRQEVCKRPQAATS
jgi:hypothetical protein